MIKSERVFIHDMPNAQGTFTFKVFNEPPVSTHIVTIVMSYSNPRWTYSHMHTVTCDALYITANTDLRTQIQVVVDGEEKCNFRVISFAQPLLDLAKTLLKDHHSMHSPMKALSDPPG
jgi:hypothetical protein